MAVKKKILCVIGPTASGKSALALEVARRSGAEILCVDSMTVYRGMDVGTAKPSADERRAVQHHLIDVAGPAESYTVARFVELADEVIVDCARRGVALVAVGGTPMYFKALFWGMFEGPGADETVRARLEQMPTPELHERLARVDPAAAARIHVNDLRRLVRALEVYELTGQPISDLQTQWQDESTVRHEAVWVGMQWDRETLSRRINARVRSMMQNGWVDEVRSLLAKHGSLSPTAGEAAGYAEIARHLAGTCSLEEATEQAKIATRQLSRRQIKWFRRFPRVQWIAGDAPLEAQVEKASNAWTGDDSAGE